MDSKPVLAIIGGSGLYAMEGLEELGQKEVETPFGPPSAPIALGRLEGKTIAFLARHGVGHTIMPSEINYRANIYALKSLGVERVLAVSACGSLREDFEPGHIVIPDQLFDHTRSRVRSFFGGGVVAHVSMADPFCGELCKLSAQAAEETGATVHRGGTYITIEGPAFSTRAESNAYRAWGMSIIGMTTSPEAYLAREARMCYAVMAHVTDYDVWRMAEEPVSVEMVIRTLTDNTALAKQAIRTLVSRVSEDVDCECFHSMEDALITAPERISADERERLGFLLDGLLD